MHDTHVVRVFEDSRVGEGVVTLEAIVVKSRRAEDVVWLFEKPGYLRAW